MAVSPALYDELLPLLIDPRREGDVMLSYCPVHNDGEKHGRQQNGRGGRSRQLHRTKGLRCASHDCDFKSILDALRTRAGPARAERENRNAPRDRPAPSQPKGIPAGTPLKVAHEYRDAVSGDLVAVHGRWEWPDESKPKGYDKTHRWRLPNGTY